MSRRIALVVEAVEECQLASVNEYYVRVTLGSTKVGTHSVAPERRTLEYNAHTLMPLSCADAPNMIIEIVDSYDRVVGFRLIEDWRRYLKGEDKGVLTATIYEADKVARMVSRHFTMRSEATSKEAAHDGPPGVGRVRVRVYLNPDYENNQRKFNRLDIYVSKISDLIVDELVVEPPHVLLRLGDNNGVDVRGRPTRGADEGEWVWEAVIPFQYQGESEVYFSVRDGRSDEEVGKAVLFVSQMAQTLAREASAKVKTSAKKGGYIPITDKVGATIGMLLIGAELWDTNSVKAHAQVDIVKGLEERIDFDEKLNASLQGSETDRVFVEGKIAEARNLLEQARIIRDEAKQGLKSRRDIKKCRQEEIVKADETEKELEAAESRLYNLACDRSREYDAATGKALQTADSLLRRCHLEADFSPRRGSTVGTPLDELAGFPSRIKNLEAESRHLKREIYRVQAMNDLPEKLQSHSSVCDSATALLEQLTKLSVELREYNEGLRRTQRLEHVREAEEDPYQGGVPPIVVQRTGLNCFACCLPQSESAAAELDELKPLPETIAQE